MDLQQRRPLLECELRDPLELIEVELGEREDEAEWDLGVPHELEVRGHRGERLR